VISKVVVSGLNPEDAHSTAVQPVDTVRASEEGPDSPSYDDVPAATPNPETPDQTALVIMDKDETPPVVPPLPDKKIMIKFTTNSNDFNPEDIDLLATLARSVRQNDNAVLKISGYTDAIGSAQYNESLSLFRANMVKSYLLGQGVLPRQLSVKGFGSVNPIADNNTPNGRRLNRRVEIEVVKQ
jgi:outer membrane protein OmpA-like peptidoglycan-associated protein